MEAVLSKESQSRVTDGKVKKHTCTNSTFNLILSWFVISWSWTEIVKFPLKEKHFPINLPSSARRLTALLRVLICAPRMPCCSQCCSSAKQAKATGAHRGRSSSLMRWRPCVSLLRGLQTHTMTGKHTHLKMWLQTEKSTSRSAPIISSQEVKGHSRSYCVSL